MLEQCGHSGAVGNRRMIKRRTLARRVLDCILEQHRGKRVEHHMATDEPTKR